MFVVLALQASYTFIEIAQNGHRYCSTLDGATVEQNLQKLIESLCRKILINKSHHNRSRLHKRVNFSDDYSRIGKE